MIQEKTHALITLYHILSKPKIAKSWLQNCEVDISLPDYTKACIISTRRYDVDFLRELIFSTLGRKEILSKIKRFPTVGQIENIVINILLGLSIYGLYQESTMFICMMA